MSDVADLSAQGRRSAEPPAVGIFNPAIFGESFDPFPPADDTPVASAQPSDKSTHPQCSSCREELAQVKAELKQVKDLVTEIRSELSALQSVPGKGANTVAGSADRHDGQTEPASDGPVSISSRYELSLAFQSVL